MYEKVMLPGTWMDRDLFNAIDEYRCKAGVSKAQGVRSLLIAGLGKAGPVVAPFDPETERRSGPVVPVMVGLYRSQLLRIDEFKLGAELGSRNAAIRSLVNLGLDTLTQRK